MILPSQKCVFDKQGLGFKSSKKSKVFYKIGKIDITLFIKTKENEKEVANMCFMAIDELDEVNSNLSDEDIHDAFEELYEDFEKLSLKNISLKKKVQQLEKELGEVK